MRVHHRVPSIFNLSMVDVLCCALGCVILLWLLNLREAKEHEQTAGENVRRTENERDSAYTMLEELDNQLRDLEAERDRVRARVTEQTALARRLDEQLGAATRQLKELEARAADSEGRAKAMKTLADTLPALRAELKEAQERAANERALAQALEKDVARRTTELTDASKTMDVLRAGRLSLQRDLEAKDQELKTADNYKARWAAAAGRVAELQKLLEERGRSATSAKQALELMEEEKKALRAEAARYRQSADNRFAGIELTGQRVVFLVDMSGSMELVDESTPAPSKWLGVRQTLVKVMQSLPNLEQFQVIVFSERATFLMGSDDRWMPFNAKESPGKVLAALAAVKPTGGTNMFAALDAAFRFRPRGLDTVYLFSDGLPNVGEGITPEQARTLKEVEQSDILGKYILKKLRTEWNAAGQPGPRVRINAVGFFYESPDVGAFLWALARENDGSFVGMSKP